MVWTAGVFAAARQRRVALPFALTAVFCGAAFHALAMFVAARLIEEELHGYIDGD